MRFARVVVGGVRDAETAAEVDLGQFDAVLVAHLGQQLHHAAGGDLEAGHVEDLRADVGVDADEFETVEGEGPADGLGGLPVGQRDAELLVLVRGGDELVGVRLDADGHPDLYGLAPAEALRDVGDADDLLEGVEHDPADTGRDGPLDLVDGLVVAVEGDARGGHAGVQRGGQLAAGADIEVEPLLLEPAHDGAGEEGLACVEDVGAGSERVGPGAAAGPEVGLVEEVGRGAELLGQPGDSDPADGQSTVLVPGDRAGPDLLVQGVEVLGGGGVVALRHDVGVTGPGGVCGSAHRDALSGLSEVSGCADTEQGQATGQHRPGGLGEGEPGTVGGRGFLVPDGKR